MNLAWLWVAALYFGAVALARRRRADLPWSVAALFYLLVLFYFFRPMTGPWVSIATDVLQLMPPWSASAPPGLDKFTVSNLQQGDVPMQLAPWAHQVREAWLSLRLPLWNELTGSGFPLISNGQGGALSPLRVAALPLSLGPSMMAEGALELLIALTFTFLYARRLGLGTAGSIVAAISYGLGPFLIVWLHFAQGTVAALLPLVLYVIDRLVAEQTYQRLAAAACVVPLVLFSGHPDTASQMALFAGAYALWITAGRRGRSWRAPMWIVGAGVLGVLLSLPFIVPFLEALPHGFRYATIEDAPRAAVPYSDFPSLLLLAQPRFFGTLPDAAWGPAHAESITGFAGILGIAGWFALLIASVRRDRDNAVPAPDRVRMLFFVAAPAAVFMVLANVGPAVDALHAVLPLGSHARMRFVFAFSLAIAAGFLVDRARHDRPWRTLLAIAGAVAVLLFIHAAMDVPGPEQRSVAIRAAVWSVAVLVAAAASIFARSRVAGLLAVTIVTAAVLCELAVVTWRWNPVRPLAELYARTPLIDAVTAAHQRSRDRVVGIGPVLFPNTNLPFGLEDVRVLDAMAPARYMRLLHSIMPSYDLGEYYVKWQDADNPLLDYLNVRWVMTEPGRDLTDRERFAPVYEGADGSLWENRHALPRFYPARNVILELDRARFLDRIVQHRDWRTTAIVDSLPVESDQAQEDLLAPRPADAPEATLRITRSSPTDYEMAVDAPRHTLVVSSVGWWKWWRAEVDGRRLRTFRVNEAFVGFIVPPGEGVVRVRFLPVSLYLAAAISVLTAAAMVVAGVSLDRHLQAEARNRAGGGT